MLLCSVEAVVDHYKRAQISEGLTLTHPCVKVRLQPFGVLCLGMQTYIYADI